MTKPEANLLKILEGIHCLMETRSQLLASDPSPPGVWIHEYEVKRRYSKGFIGVYRYAKWQSHEPIFRRNPKKNARPPRREKDPGFTCHQHIGRVSSNTGLESEPEVLEAYQKWNNRKQLDAVEQALQEIQSILSRFVPCATEVMPDKTN